MVRSYRGESSYTQANAGLFKNNAAIKKTEAANQWNYYQAKSSKQNLAELSTVLVTQPEAKEKYRAAIERYQTEKEDIKRKAEALEKESLDWDHQSDAQMHQHHRWSQATTMLQVAIALAAIALLTRRDWMEYAMFGLASVGLVLGGMAYLHL
jgi:organic radical activating enzyme